MKELNQEQHIQLLQFMSLMQTCKTEEELQALKEQYFNIPRYEFLQDYISEKSENQSLSSYKTSLIYEMDKYQHDYKIVYGENFPAYKKETMPNNKADYTVIHLLNEISECDDIEAYQKLMEEKNRFPRVKIEALSHEFTGIYFSNENELPTNIILNSPESNFNARRQLVEAGYSPFTLPSVEDVRENGFEWLHEEISHFKETLNPNFIEQETQRNQEPEFNEQEYEEEYDDFIEPMDENDGMSAMAAEADYNGSLIENEDIDEVQHQIDIDNGLIDENENEIMYDGSESEQEENFEEYIHSEKFISKFGDWEKANRLEKLRNAESIIKDGKITLNNSDITETVESLIDNEDRKGLQSLEKEIGKNILGVYVNPDTGLTINVSNRNVTEISNHHYLFKEHIQSLSFIPEIIDKAILIGEVENEDKQKHPNIEKYLYFGTGIKIDGVDYTCKSVVGIDKNNNCYYDQSLSTIEKGRLVDYIFKNEKVGNLSPLITQRETDLEGNDLPYVYYDKRLINICQVPQMPYLEKNTITGKWQPTKEAVEAVKNGALFVEKQGQTYGMNERELKITNKVEQENKIMDSVENKKYLQEADFEKYIHSEEFISKFGDWEKASRLQKLSEAPSIIKNGRVIIEGEDVTEEVNNFRNDEDNKVLRIFAKDIGRSVKGTYHNDDLDIDVVLSMGNIDEIKNHHMAMSGHLEAIQYIPDIIKQGIYIAEEPNEDKTKHPNIEKYKYFVSTLKIDGVDYTCKSAIGVDKDGNHYYDQRLSQIEKGLLLDNLSQLMSRGKSEQSLLNYDKRLLRICQCPQSLYLDKELKPTKEAIKLVKTGKLYLEKDKNGFQLLHDIDKNKIIGKELSEMIEKNMPDTIDSKHDVQKGSDMSQDNISNILDTPTNSMKVNKSLNTEFSNNDIPVENNEVEQEPEPENESQNYENNNSNVSAPKPKNKQELHQFFINNPYTSGTPVPTIAMRNEQTGHSTFIEGYEFARLEDIGKPNPAFRDENGKQIKPDGQTVVLTKPAFKEVIDEETGEKKLVPDDKNRKFIRISRDLYEQAIKNSEIIAKRNPKTEQEKQKMLDDYLEAAHLDEKKQHANTASNFWHNYKAGVMTIANNKQEAMAFAKRLVIEMIPSEREKFAAMVRKYEKLRGTDGKHLSYDQRIIDFYDNMGLKITNNSIWRDHVDEKYNTLDAIKQNTEVFDKEGQPLDKSCRMKIGDTIKMSVTVDSALSNKKIKLPIQEYRLVAHSKDNNSVALISADGKQKIIKNREDFIKEVQKVEKKLMKKQQREDRYESISM